MQERSPPVSLIGLGMTEAITTAAKSHNDDEDSTLLKPTVGLKKQERDRFLKFHALPTIYPSLPRKSNQNLNWHFGFCLFCTWHLTGMDTNVSISYLDWFVCLLVLGIFLHKLYALSANVRLKRKKGRFLKFHALPTIYPSPLGVATKIWIASFVCSLFWGFSTFQTLYQVLPSTYLGWRPKCQLHLSVWLFVCFCFHFSWVFSLFWMIFLPQTFHALPSKFELSPRMIKSPGSLWLWMKRLL